VSPPAKLKSITNTYYKIIILLLIFKPMLKFIKICLED
jgi:hypothetical protein